jgi:hypothetical protein
LYVEKVFDTFALSARKIMGYVLAEGGTMQQAKQMTAWRGARMGGILALALALSAFFALYLYSVDLQRERGNKFDIYPRYVGAQAVWAGESPYTQAVTERIQMGMYGRLQPPDADQQRFAHPAYSAVLLAPLLLFPPEVAIPLWIALQFAALFATPILWLMILRWKPRPLTVVLLIIGFVVVYRYPGLSYLWGQFTGGIVFLVSLAIWLVQRQRDGWAGVALALATVPPSVSGLLAVLLLGTLLLLGRWRGTATFVAVLGVATLISILRVGWWLPDFIDGLRAYSVYAHPVSAVDFLLPFARPLFMIGVSLALLWSGWRVVKEQMNRRKDALDVHTGTSSLVSARSQTPTPFSLAFLRFICVASLACLLLLPQTGSYYLVLGIPILMICAWKANRARRWGWMVVIFIAATIASPWLWVVIGLPDVETLVTPLMLAITLGVAMWADRVPARS